MGTIIAIDILGTIVFAVSGALTAIDKKMDVFGAAVVAFLTALGGGTIRDVLLGATPPGWARDPMYILYVFIGLAFAVVFKNRILSLKRTFFIFDTIGIAVFTILGVEKTLQLGLSPWIAIIMGMVSAVFGGVLRDIASNEIPLIFRKEIYALVCIVAGALYIFVLDFLPVTMEWKIWLVIIFVIVSRIIILRYNVALPPMGQKS